MLLLFIFFNLISLNLRADPDIDQWQDSKKTYRDLIDEGFEVCIWPKWIVQKDINDMVLKGLSPNIIVDTINKNKFSGLKAKMALSDWSKISG